MPTQTETGFAPSEITGMLRVEGLALLAASVTAFYLIGGNWWAFAGLILAPDLAMLGFFVGRETGSRLYNLGHTTTVPALLGGIAWFAGPAWLLSIAVIWLAHIGIDRALGYGLKYPGTDRATHLGWIGKAKSGKTSLANAS